MIVSPVMESQYPEKVRLYVDPRGQGSAIRPGYSAKIAEEPIVTPVTPDDGTAPVVAPKGSSDEGKEQGKPATAAKAVPSKVILFALVAVFAVAYYGRG